MISAALVSLAFVLAADPTADLPVRMLSLPTDPAYLRTDGAQLYVSGFHSGKLVTLGLNGKAPPHELRLDAYETYRNDPKRGMIREIRRAAGGDLAIAHGKIFIGQVFQGSILVVDQETFTPVKRLPFGGEGRFAVSVDGRNVFFANNLKPEFRIIDSKTYEHRTVPYPEGGKGIGCLATSPDGRRLYLGIQRGGRLPDGTRLSGGNCFLAVFDLEKNRYLRSVFLARKLPNGEGDDAIPTSLAFVGEDRLYVGTFQSEAGVLVVDLKKNEVRENIYFAPKVQNPGLPWVDPMSVAVFDRWLLVAVRGNQEVAAVDLASHRTAAVIRHSEAVDIERVVVAGGRILVSGGSSSVTMIRARDLTKLLAEADVQAGVLRMTLRKKSQ